MTPLLAAGLVAVALVVAAMIIAQQLTSSRARRTEEALRTRRLQILALFAPGVAAVREDPGALLVWQPLAATARTLFPDDFAELDRASGTAFPFSSEQLQAAHARWSAAWLAWEGTHDSEYKLKAAELEEQLRGVAPSPLARSRLENVEREKLEKYQQRYAEYVRVSKALKALTDG